MNLNLNKNNRRIPRGALFVFSLVIIAMFGSNAASVTVIHPNIALTKYASVPVVENGTSVTYTYNVANTGDITLTNVYIIDNVSGLITSGQTLNVTETKTFTHAAVLTSNTTNIATTNGTDILGTIIRNTSAAVFVRVIHPNISVNKTCINQTAGNLSWQIVVNNTGDVSLSNVTLNDSIDGSTFVIGTLAPDVPVVTSITNSSTAAGSYFNTATANGTDELGNQVNATSSATCTIAAPTFAAFKDFRFADVNFTASPAKLGTLLPQNGSKYNVSYVLKKDGTVASTNPGQLYGVITINGTGVANVTVNDTFNATSGPTQFLVNPAKLGGGVEIIRVNTTTGNAVDITNTTQITSAIVNNTAGTVNLTIDLGCGSCDTPLASDENLMIYIKFMTALKGQLPNYADFVNTAVVTTNLGGSKTATAAINFVPHA